MELYSQNQPCIGRRKVLDRLNHIFNSKTKKDFHKKITVLTGLGGIGKSFVVNEYLKKYPQTPAVLIRADTYTTLSTDFTELAKRFGIPNGASTKQTVEEFYKFVSENVKQLLIIFDNAHPSSFSEKTEDLHGGVLAFLPSTELSQRLNYFPSILITSRFRSWSFAGKPLRLIVLKELKQVEKEKYLLEKFCPQSVSLDDKDWNKVIHKLAKSLQGYPLTLILAAAYLENVLMTSEYHGKNNEIILKFVQRLKLHLSRNDTSSELPYSKLNASKERYDTILSFVWNTSLAAISAHEKGKGAQFYMATISLFYPFENWFRFTVPLENLETFRLLEKFALVPPTKKNTPDNTLFARVTIDSKHLSKQLVGFMQSDALDHPEHVFINNHPISWMFLDFYSALHSGLKKMGWPGMGFRISNLFLLNLLVNATDQDRSRDRSGFIPSIAHLVLKDLSNHEEQLRSGDRKKHAIDIAVLRIAWIIWTMAYANFDRVRIGLESDAESCLTSCLDIMLDHKNIALVQIFGAKVIHSLYVETSIQYSKVILTKLSHWVTQVLVPSGSKFDSYYRYPWDKFARIHRIAFKLTEECEEVLPLSTLFSLYFQQLDQEMNADSPLAFRYWLLLCGYVKEKKLFWNFPILSKSFPFDKPGTAAKERIYNFVEANEASDVSGYDDLKDLNDVLRKLGILNPEFDLQMKLDRAKRLMFIEAGGLLMLIKGIKLSVERKKLAYLMKICEIIQELCRWEESRAKLQASQEFLLAIKGAITSIQEENATLIERSALLFLSSTAFAVSLDLDGKCTNESSTLAFFTNVLREAYNQFLKIEKSCPHATLLYISPNEGKYTCVRSVKKFVQAYSPSGSSLSRRIHPVHRLAQTIEQLLERTNPMGNK